MAWSILHLQGVWLGGYGVQAESSVPASSSSGSPQTHEATMDFTLALDFVVSNNASLGATLSFSLRAGLVEAALGGCGPHELWTRVSAGRGSVWYRGPC